MNDRVIILLSTYNGEKYIAEQIDSILKQTYDNIRLFIRDDGSTDNTIKVLKTYENNPKVNIVYGENIGFFASFLWLLNQCEEAGYYAYADQDDFWFPDKISAAVKKLQEYSGIPTLYCCNSNYCDANMNYIDKSIKYECRYSLERSIINGETGWGYTQVMNNSLRKLLVGRTAPSYYKVFGHDTWTHMMALCRGKIIYDDTVHVNMRRHGNNTSVQELHGGNKLHHQIWRINQFLVHSRGKLVYNEVEAFYNTFQDEVPNSCKKIMKLYMMPGHRIKKAVYPKRYRNSWGDEILLRILFIVGKM